MKAKWSARAWIERITQTITEEIAAHDHAEERDAGKDGDPPLGKIVAALTDHDTPLRCVGWHAHADETHGSQRRDGIAQIDRGQDDDRTHHVWDNSPPDNAQRAHADRTRG